MRGSFDESLGGGEQWCARRLLARVHSYTQARLRREIEPVTAQDYMRFLLQWQHVSPGTQRQGRAGVLAVIDQLQGFELPAGAWEESVLTARVENYQTRWLEDLCMSGELVWGRLSVRPPDAPDNPRRGASTPSRATPITFASRADLPWLLEAARGDSVPAEPLHGAAKDVLDALRDTRRTFPLGDRRAHGTASGRDRRRALGSRHAGDRHRRRIPGRPLLAVRSRGMAQTAPRRGPKPCRPRDAPHCAEAVAKGAGRCCRRASSQQHEDPDTLAESVAGQLLARWGVVFWDLLSTEELVRPVAPVALGAAPARSPWPRARRPFRDGFRRRAVRATRGGGSPSPVATVAA